MSAPGVGVERAETPVRVQGPNIIGVDGNVLAMKGINWFGFDVRGQSIDECINTRACSGPFNLCHLQGYVAASAQLALQ